MREAYQKKSACPSYGNRLITHNGAFYCPVTACVNYNDDSLEERSIEKEKERANNCTSKQSDLEMELRCFLCGSTICSDQGGKIIHKSCGNKRCFYCSYPVAYKYYYCSNSNR